LNETANLPYPSFTRQLALNAYSRVANRVNKAMQAVFIGVGETCYFYLEESGTREDMKE
jgi:hypothetical protein